MTAAWLSTSRSASNTQDQQFSSFCVRNIQLGIRFYISISEEMKRLTTTVKSGTITIRQCLSASSMCKRAELSASPDCSLTYSPGHLTCLGNRLSLAPASHLSLLPTCTPLQNTTCDFLSTKLNLMLQYQFQQKCILRIDQNLVAYQYARLCQKSPPIFKKAKLLPQLRGQLKFSG